MKMLQAELKQQLAAFLEALQATAEKPGDPEEAWKACLELCMNQLRQLRKCVPVAGFPDAATEIYFFKHIKPVVVAHWGYYQQLLKLHQGATRSSRHEKERLEKELDNCCLLLLQHEEFWCYCRSNSTCLDEAYFLRKNNDWQHCSMASGFDEEFCTARDGLLAQLLMSDRLVQYLEWQLAERGEPANGVSDTDVVCTATTTQVVVLVIALQLIGFFNRGTLTDKAIMRYFGRIWKIDLSNYRQLINQLAHQKNPGQFLVDLLNVFNRFIDDKLNK